jgi:hypothetical protein
LTDSSGVSQPSRPGWQILLAYVATLLGFVACLKLLPALIGLSRDRVGWTALGVLVLMIQPRVWWVWEMGGIRELRSWLGDTPVRLIYGAIGLVSLYAGLFTSIPFGGH